MCEKNRKEITSGLGRKRILDKKFFRSDFNAFFLHTFQKILRNKISQRKKSEEKTVLFKTKIRKHSATNVFSVLFQ